MENRETFLARLRPVVPPGELLDIQLAYTLAKYAHRAQVRSERDAAGAPLRYFEHPRRVALILIDLGRILDPLMLEAALLHDGIEDTPDLTAAMIERHWGSDVARLVQALSKVPEEGYLDRLWAFGDWRVLLIKAADRLDNLRSLRPDQVSAAFRARQLEETRAKYLPLFEHLLEIVPMAVRPGALRIVAEIRALASAPV